MRVNVNDNTEYERKISLFYETCKEEFFALIRRRYVEVPMEDIRDLYQEAFIAMHENIRNGRYEERPACSLKTYLFQIGINKMRDHFKKKQKEAGLNDYGEQFPDLDEIMEDQDSVYSVVSAMQSPCKEILFAFYWDELSMDEIASRMSYKDATVAKSQKYRCVRKVADLLRQMGIVGEKNK